MEELPIEYLNSRIGNEHSLRILLQSEPKKYCPS